MKNIFLLTALLPLATGEVLLGTRHRGVLIYNGATLAPLQFTLPGVNPASLQITALAAVAPRSGGLEGGCSKTLESGFDRKL